MISLAMDIGEVEGLDVGRGKVCISLLQFAYDTILFASGDERKFSNLNLLVKCVGLLSGLKVNLGKSALVAINMVEIKVIRLACSMGVRCASFL